MDYRIMKRRIFLPKPIVNIYERPYKYSDEQNTMGIITKELKPIKITELYDDISSDLNNKHTISFKNISKFPDSYNQTNSYNSTYFNTRINKMYNFSKVKSRILKTKGYGFEFLIKDINKKMKFLNILYKTQEIQTQKKIRIGDKNQIINSNIIKDNTIANRETSRKEYKKTMNELYSRIKRIKN